MNISATFIRKPIATAMLMAAILLLELIGYELLPVAALPNIDSPTIQVTAQLPGANAQTVAGTVATPVERQFGQIPGLTQMTPGAPRNTRRSHCNSTAAAPSIRQRRMCRRRSMRRPANCRRRCQVRRSTERPTRPTRRC